MNPEPKKFPPIYAICDNSLAPRRTHERIAKDLLKGGIRLIQLRMKGEKDRGRVQETAEGILSLKKDFDFTFILNDWPELASDLGADGVHLGQDDPPVGEARRILGNNAWIGYSAHSLAEAQEAEGAGADYVALGAIFPTRLKGPGHPIQGLEKLGAVVQSVRIPVVAIGGITRENFPQVVRTGVSSVAMIGALTIPEDLTTEAAWFIREWEKERGDEA